MSERVTAVLLAGGSGERMGAGVPKQFMDLAGAPVISYSLDTLDRCPMVAEVIVVLTDDVPDEIHDIVDRRKVISIAIGGATRQDSLGSGLNCLSEAAELVIVHDAARPLASPDLFARVIEGVGEGFAGAIAAIPVDDALKEASSNGEIGANRSKVGMWRAQTPQAFLREPLEDALARADAAMSVAEDCSQMLLDAGYRVRIVPGESRNIKITHSEDLVFCAALLTRA